MRRSFPCSQGSEALGHCVQGEDAQRTIALMEAKIKRLQSIVIRNQPQEEQHLRTIHSLEQVLLCDTLETHFETLLAITFATWEYCTWQLSTHALKLTLCCLETWHDEWHDLPGPDSGGLGLSHLHMGQVGRLCYTR